MSCALGKSPLRSVVLVAAFFSGDGLLRVLPGFLSDFLGPVACHYRVRCVLPCSPSLPWGGCTSWVP